MDRRERGAYISRLRIDPDATLKMTFPFEPKVALKMFEDRLAESNDREDRLQLGRQG